jgi:hypothetical protein
MIRKAEKEDISRIAEIDKMALIKWEEDNPYQELAVYDLK